MAQKTVHEKRKETEKKEERRLTEKEWHSTMQDVLMRGLERIIEKLNKGDKQQSEAYDRLFKAKNDYDSKKDGRALEEVVDYAKKALNQLVETLEVFGYSKEGGGNLIFVEIDNLQHQCDLHKQKEEPEKFEKELEDQKKENEKLEAMGAQDVPPLARPQDVILSSSSSYTLGPKLGEGGYGQVFMCTDKHDSRRAIKFERFDAGHRSTLPMEIEVMKSARNAGCKHFLEMYDYGSKPPEFNYVVMSLLHKDLHQLRIQQEDRRFSLSTTYRIATQTMQAVQELHKIGYISRDIKPSNFAPGLRENNQNRVVYMFDLGLARRFLDTKGNMIPKRKVAGWRGTNRYASLEAHRGQDQGRRDDVESWFYLVVEATTGSLPWRLVSDRPKVYEAKMYAREAGRKQLFRNSPEVYDEFMAKIDSLQYEHQPPYEYFLSKLRALSEKSAYREADLFDWQLDDNFDGPDEEKESSDQICATQESTAVTQIESP